MNPIKNIILYILDIKIWSANWTALIILLNHYNILPIKILISMLIIGLTYHETIYYNINTNIKDRLW